MIGGRKDKSKGMHLYFVKPEMLFRNVFEILRRKAIAYEREQGNKSCNENEAVYMFYKKSQKLIQRP
jgi:hypothetical protein